ncbi:MAG: PIG-L family deacetylase [Chitinophagaceae bacterium]|nr:PIG-L family deacetylase [Chitinophagaceae bacterium]
MHDFIIRENTKVLALAPHTDDVELGCGATLHALKKKNAEIHYAAFSLCKESLPEGFAPDTLRKECFSAASIIGIPETQVHFFDFPVRRFAEYRQEILEILIQLRNKIGPELVFIPSSTDLHQDHQVIFSEAVRAFKNVSVIGYELPWNETQSLRNVYIPLQGDDLEAKINALKKYESQKDRIYMQEDFIRSLAKVRGIQCGKELAEAFEVVKLIL